METFGIIPQLENVHELTTILYILQAQNEDNVILKQTVKNGKLCEFSAMNDQTLAEIQTIFLPKTSTFNLIPDNLLAIEPNTKTMLWWTPATTRYLRFAKELKIPSGKATIPAMLFCVKNRTMYSWALAENKKPTLTTQLYHAPFPNVYDGGNICTGDIPLPTDVTIASIKDWEKVYFNSDFTYELLATTKELTGRQLWTKIYKEKPKEFPTKYLKPYQTFRQIIKSFNIKDE